MASDVADREKVLVLPDLVVAIVQVFVVFQVRVSVQNPASVLFRVLVRFEMPTFFPKTFNYLLIMLSKKVKQALWDERIQTESVYCYYIKMMDLFSKRLKIFSLSSFIFSMTIVFLSVLRFLDSLPFDPYIETIFFIVLAFFSAIFSALIYMANLSFNLALATSISDSLSAIVDDYKNLWNLRDSLNDDEVLAKLRENDQLVTKITSTGKKIPTNEKINKKAKIETVAYFAQ